MIEIEKMSKDDLIHSIEIHEKKLKRKQLKIKKIKSSKKKKMIRKTITALMVAGGVVLTGKVLGTGYPFYKENIKKNAEITYEIDNEGNKKEIGREYNYPNYEGLIDLISDTEMKLEILNYLKVENQWINSDINYVEKYKVINDMTLEEILKILKKQNVDLTTIFGEPEIIRERVELKEKQKSGVKLIQKEIDKNDFILDKESDYRNNSWSTGFIIIWLLGYMAIDLISTESDIEQEVKKEEELIRKLKLEYDKRK